MPAPLARCIAAALLVWSETGQTAVSQDEAETRDLVTRCEFVERQTLTIPNLGAGQGISRREVPAAGGEPAKTLYYAYGDRYDLTPRVGWIVELDETFRPTGREIRLADESGPRIVHPTGLAWLPQFGCFIGDTIKAPKVEGQPTPPSKAKIYRVDWEQALRQGDLTAGAIEAVINDDLAINGCRPCAVYDPLAEVDQPRLRPLYLATADYGDVRPTLRLYDPASLLARGRSSHPGVCRARILIGSFNQNLAFDPATARMFCVQNATEGLGWQLEVFDLRAAMRFGRSDAPAAERKILLFDGTDELEGFVPLSETRGVFVTASRKDNLVVGTWRETTD